jgi:phosphoglycerate kinase
MPILIPTFDFVAGKAQITAAQPGAFFVLENIRFAPGEENSDASFAQGLASLGDLYVNDAFAVDHHGSVSVSAVAKLLPAYAGFLVQQEVEHLGRIRSNAEKPMVVIIGGGGKAGEKFAVIKNLYNQTDHFLIGGVMANTFLKARGVDVGSSQTDETIAEDVKKYLHDPKIVLPTDWVAGDNGAALDLGEKSAAAFAAIISTAKTVVWNGPMGKFEQPQYRAGSLALAQAIVKSGAFSVAGGGETTEFLLQSNLGDKFSFLSTGGGAMLAYLAGKPMPGLEAIQ